jgi:signal transduction histidine kinase
LTSDVIAVNRRGKTVQLRVAASPMHTEEGAVSGIILVIDADDPQ